MLGTKHVVRLHEWQDQNDAMGGGVLILDGFSRRVFNHNAAFVAPTTKVTKNDFPMSDNDGWTVEYAYPEGSEPDLASTTVDALRTQAALDINAFERGAVDSQLTDPSAF